MTYDTRAPRHHEPRVTCRPQRTGTATSRWSTVAGHQSLEHQIPEHQECR